MISTSSPDAPLPGELEDRLPEFTEQVATALATSEVHKELARLAREQAALRHVATLVARGIAPADLFETVSVEVARLIPAEGAALTRFEHDGTVTALETARRSPPDPVSGAASWRPGRALRGIETPR